MSLLSSLLRASGLGSSAGIGAGVTPTWKRFLCLRRQPLPLRQAEQPPPLKRPPGNFGERVKEPAQPRIERPQHSFGKRENRLKGKPKLTQSQRIMTTYYYALSGALLTVAVAYAAVPLYRVFCQTSGYGGTVQEGHDTEKVATMKKDKKRKIQVRFNADTAASIQWNFRPQQHTIHVAPGETALAFYTACNPTDKPIDGISTYNVVPFEAGQYFNKIQCFCFEEQRLNPHEEVDLPVFFYIDPEYADDPFLANVDVITLSYTFFQSKPGIKLPNFYSSEFNK